MKSLTEQERQDALTSLCKIEIRRWKKAAEAVPEKKYMVELMEIALAALQAEPVAWEVKGIFCHTKEEAEKFVGNPEPLYECPPATPPAPSAPGIEE